MGRDVFLVYGNQYHPTIQMEQDGALVELPIPYKGGATGNTPYLEPLYWLREKIGMLGGKTHARFSWAKTEFVEADADLEAFIDILIRYKAAREGKDAAAVVEVFQAIEQFRSDLMPDGWRETVKLVHNGNRGNFDVSDWLVANPTDEQRDRAALTRRIAEAMPAFYENEYKAIRQLVLEMGFRDCFPGLNELGPPGYISPRFMKFQWQSPTHEKITVRWVVGREFRHVNILINPLNPIDLEAIRQSLSCEMVGKSETVYSN